MKIFNPSRLLTLATAIFACALLWVSSAAAATDTVTTAGDSGPGSLRDTVAKATAGDTIRFAVGLTNSTIELASPVAIDKSLTIKGPGAGKLAISGGANSRLLELTAGDLALSGLTFADGKAAMQGGAILASGTGSLTISACSFTGNAVGDSGSAQQNAPALEGVGFGGAVYISATAGPVLVESSDFDGNTAGGDGGTGSESAVGHGSAIWDLSSQPVRVVDSQFGGNAAGGQGGPGEMSGAGFGTVGGEGAGSLEIVNSRFGGNSAGGPGGSGLESAAGFGAAVWAGPGLSLTVTAGEFEENAAGGTGGSGEASGLGQGAVSVGGSGSSAITDSVFRANTAGGNGGTGQVSGAGYGAAIFVGPGRSLDLGNSSFDSNVVGGDGNGNESGAGFGAAVAGRGEGSISVSESRFASGTAGGIGGAGDFSGAGNGGAISTQDAKSLAISESDFVGNGTGGQGGRGGYSGLGRGGAIYVGGSGGATIADSTFEGNHGGGVRAVPGAGVQSGNAQGGAIFAIADTSITSSTLYANSAGVEGSAGAAGFGGAVDFVLSADATYSITNSTLYENFAGGEVEPGSGGAVHAEGEVGPGDGFGALTLASDTIVGNRVEAGGTGGNGTGSSIGNAGAVSVAATLITAGGGAPDCDVPVADSSYSFDGREGETSCGLDLPSAEDELGTFGENGGPTETFSLTDASPAVDAVPGASCPEADQRGELRASRTEPFCDVGAFELDPRTAPTITSAATASFEVGKSGSFTVTTTGEPQPVLFETGALPSGVTFVDKGDGTAILAGTPAAGSGGTYTITIAASNGFVVKPEATQAFTLTVIGPPPPKPSTPSAPSSSPAPSPTPASPSSPPPASPPPPGPKAPSLRFTYNPNRAHSPGRKGGGPRYTFRFDDGVAGSTYLCRLDGGRFKPCTSPKVYRNLKRGRHVFEVKSMTPAGLESAVRRVGFRARKPRS